MNPAQFDTLLRDLMGGSLTRRGVALGVGASAVATSLALIGPADTGARRRGGRKRRNKKKQRDNNGGNRDRCQFATCDGQCVDLDTEPNNCGACGDACPEGTSCVGGLCAFAVGTSGAGRRQFDGPAGVGFDANGNSFAADANNNRVARFAGLLSFDGIDAECTKDEDCIELCGPLAACNVCAVPGEAEFRFCAGPGSCPGPQPE